VDRLFKYSKKLIQEANTDFFRYLYDKINWNNRLIGLVGARGVGKTTLLLQYIKTQLNAAKTLYVNAEDFYFAENRLVDLAADFTNRGGTHLFIDEIHKYEDWAKELKLIYDYHPDLQIVFSGSSILDIRKGSSDLSRRAIIYTMQGLSFREYLNLFHQIEIPVYLLDEILDHQVKTPKDFHPLPLFKSYLKQGVYPFAKEDDYSIRLRQIINQTLENDIPFFAEMKVATGRKLKHLLSIAAKSVPFKPNRSKIAEMIGASRNNIADYLLWIEEAGLIAQLRSSTQGIRSLGKVKKVYLDNSNLMYNLGNENVAIGNVRETFFFNQLKLNHKITASKQADFEVDRHIFEVGGKNKTQAQIKDLQNAYIAKDDIEEGYLNVIPLWQFGLLY